MKIRNLLALVALVFLTGCRAVQVDGEWSDQIDRDAARLRAIALDARAGKYQPSDMVRILELYADKWAVLKAAKNGELPPEATTQPK